MVPRETEQHRQVLVVATNGGAASAGALRCAGRLAERDDVVVELVSVGFLGGPGRRVQRLLSDTFVSVPEWNHTVADGDVADTLAYFSQRSEATLVLVGLSNHHGARADIYRIVNTVSAPVLAVPPSVTDLPRRGAVAMDFKEASIRVARTALHVMGRPAELLIVTSSVAASAAPIPSPAALLFDALQDTLGGPADVTVRHTPVSQPLTPPLVDFAVRQVVDLIAIGRHRSSRAASTRRRILGPTAANVLAAAPCSVLIGSAEDKANLVA